MIAGSVAARAVVTLLAVVSLLYAAIAACAQFGDPTRASGVRDTQVRVTGSSTVFPFSRTVAEHYAAKFAAPSPIVEATGTGGGVQRFCDSRGSIHIVNASRRMKPSEAALCATNGVAAPLEVRIGYDGIVVATGRGGALTALTAEQIYRAIAKDLPLGGGFEPNPNRTWADVDPSLPDIAIDVHGPPPTSGTREAFAELGLERGAKAIPALADLAKSDPQAFAARAHALREDGRWVDEGENDNAIIQLVRVSPGVVGVFGYSFYEQNRTLLEAVTVDGAAPDLAAIASGDYPLSRSLYFYVNDGAATAAAAAYVLEFTSEAAFGPLGYLIDKGLIPLGDNERREERRKAEALAASVDGKPNVKTKAGGAR